MCSSTDIAKYLRTSGAIACFILWALLGNAADLKPGATSHVQVDPVDLTSVHWTRGFWADRFELCRTQTIPAMWRLMEGTNFSHYLENFKIAAGLTQGRHRGAPFNDGDFYKLLEAACALIAVRPDPIWQDQIDRAIDIIALAQRNDGYLHTPVLIAQRRGDTNAVPFQGRNNFELYNLGHLFTTACVHHRVTGKTNLLTVACRAANFLYTVFSQATPHAARSSVCPSHYMGMVDLYRETADPRYLELAHKFLELRSQIADGGDDNQDRIPFTAQTNAVGHAVRANYLYAGAADLFMETREPQLGHSLEQIWSNVVQKKMYVTGGCGALYDGASPDAAKDQRSITRVHQAYGRNYQLPNVTAHNETCANIGNVLWNWRMFRASAEARFIDVLELALYNSVLAGVSLDGTNFFYVNPLRTLNPLPAELRWPRTRVPYLSSFCCPPNLARTLVELGGYAYGKSADALWVNLYGGNTLTTKIAGENLKLTQETEYPWNGRIRLRIDECGEKPFSFNLRIPGWANGASIRLDNAPLEVSASPGTYLKLHRRWRGGQVLDLDLPMSVQTLEANPLVEETLNQVAIKRGPLIYCLESIDLPRATPLTSLSLQPGLEWRARYDSRLLGGIVVLEGRLTVRHTVPWTDQLYRDAQSSVTQSIDGRLIPYYSWGNRGPGEMTVWLPRE